MSMPKCVLQTTTWRFLHITRNPEFSSGQRVAKYLVTALSRHAAFGRNGSPASVLACPSSRPLRPRAGIATLPSPVPPGETPAAFPPEPTRVRVRAGSAGQGRWLPAARGAGRLEGRGSRRATLPGIGSDWRCVVLAGCPAHATKRALRLPLLARFMALVQGAPDILCPTPGRSLLFSQSRPGVYRRPGSFFIVAWPRHRGALGSARGPNRILEAATPDQVRSSDRFRARFVSCAGFNAWPRVWPG